ncbi:hypothetical protein AVEN_94394-1 [Araneus ventricosus]|uniref:Integrase catalytic domain-containing protein n=1 Tax=Araneus ventricosus TaxID=182803 RepID=A0A4Y2EB14_ARAVE|nr:hypothetical protein AVEN_94394-1 [Araneus ventricosus]
MSTNSTCSATCSCSSVGGYYKAMVKDSVASNNGTSEEFQNFLSRNGIKHILVVPYHPSSNGQAERVVQTTKDALKRIITGNWNQRLTQHITTSATTGFSPAELLMKRRLRTVLDPLHSDLVEDRKRKNEVARPAFIKGPVKIIFTK